MGAPGEQRVGYPGVTEFVLGQPSLDEVFLVQVHPDAASADDHMQAAGEKIGQGLELSETIGVEVYGEPGPVVRHALEANAAAGVPVSVKPSRLGAFHRLPRERPTWPSRAL